MIPRAVAVLFARSDSVYKKIPGCDVWDIDRDARRWPGGAPVVAHPPCRAWGSLRTFAKPMPGEKEHALWAVDQVRRFGGVLEHPAASTLWKVKPLPMPQEVDEWGGWTLPVSQFWFGHRAEKKTFLYIVGCVPADMPTLPIVLGVATHVIAQNRLRKGGIRVVKGMPAWKPEVTKSECEHTPAEMAVWLCEVARRCAIARSQVLEVAA